MSEGDPRFKHTPWETTLKFEEGEIEIKKRETDEVKGADLHVLPCSRLNLSEDWLLSKDNVSQTF